LVKINKMVMLENNIVVKGKNLEKIAKYTNGLAFAPIKRPFEIPTFDFTKKTKK
jgi:hypothetical protein